MKTKKRLLRKTKRNRKQQKEKTLMKRKHSQKGGASQGNIENWNPQNENFSQPSGIGYQAYIPNYSLTKRKVNQRAEEPNRGYEGNIEDYVENNDYDEYIEDLILNMHTKTEHGCSTMTLQERLHAIEIEIRNVSMNYNKLIQNIADKTMSEFITTGSFDKSYSNELSNWYQSSSKRASIYQQTSSQDLEKAFLYLLPSFNSTNKFFILDQNKNNQSSMRVMVKNYEYKMVTELFTKANITYAVLNYTENNPKNHDQENDQYQYQYLKNLLGLMHGGSQLINQLLLESWHTFLPEENEIGDTRYVHSGGNLILLLAGVICYLYEKRNKVGYVLGEYENNILEDIRKDMDDYLRTHDAIESFYVNLHTLMQNPIVRELLKGCTSNISDMDFILMAQDHYVDHIEIPELFSINELSAYVLKQIIVLAHRDKVGPWENNAKTLLPFAGMFHERWKHYDFFNKSGVTPETVKGMVELNEGNYLGYRQTSNKIPEVPMYLNRIKQGYAPFYEIPMNIPSNLQLEYSNKYGECIDLSIGVRTNLQYIHKQENFKKNRYYSIDTLLIELAYIISKPTDDKTEKRKVRYTFLEAINDPYFNALFHIIGNKIT